MNLLKHLYTFDAKSLNEQVFTSEVIRLCKEYGATVTTDKSGNVYCQKGESETYPCVVAHLDEVHNSRGKKFCIVSDGNIIKGYDNFERDIRHGIGADDKNGIWVALRCLEKFDVIKCAFFVGEEIGCVGSGRADMAFFEDCRFVLQCDRRNDSDLITSIYGTQLCSKRFLKEIKPQQYGYVKTTGALTDVYTLKRYGLKVSCVNMSCGYYNPHSSVEYTNFAHLCKCLKFVEHIVKDCTDVYAHDKRSEKQPVVSNENSKMGNSLSIFDGHDYPFEFNPIDKREEMLEIITECLEAGPTANRSSIMRELKSIYNDKFDKALAEECLTEAMEWLSGAI